MRSMVVPAAHVGLLFEDGAFVRLLDPGKVRLKAYDWAIFDFLDDVRREVTLVDLRERSLVIKGQEILTEDKVAIRVSLLVYYRVTDPEAAVLQVASYVDRIYEDVQLAARRFLASRRLDAILSDRNEISDAVRVAVEESASGYGVEIRRADVKDLVFPGNLREIMNRVLETERRAEAQLIEARKAGEARRIQAEADAEATRLRLEAEKVQIELRNQAEAAKSEARLKAEVAEAQALREHPELLALRRLKTLEGLARAGGKFVIGLDRDLATPFLSPESPEDA